MKKHINRPITLLLSFLILSCCDNAKTHDKSGLTTVSTITPEAKSKYFPEEIDDVTSPTIEFVVSASDGYGNIRKYPNKKSKIITAYTNGIHFNGVYSDTPRWIKVIDNNGETIGFMHDVNVTRVSDEDYKTVSKTENGEYYSYEEEDFGESQKSSKSNSNSALEESKKKNKRADLSEHYHFEGYMTDEKGDHPIELDFDASNNGLTNIVYKNVTLGGKIRMKCTEFSGIKRLPDNVGGYSNFLDSFTIVGKDGPKDFIMKMTRIGNSPYEGTARVGSKRLSVMLYLG